MLWLRSSPPHPIPLPIRERGDEGHAPVNNKLSQIMIEHVHPAMFDHVHSRKFHHFSNPRFIITMVTLGLAFLAHGLGIMRALQPHGQTICEKPWAIRAEGNLFLFDLSDIEKFERKRRLLPIVILSAVDPYKFYQCPDIILFLVWKFHPF